MAERTADRAGRAQGRLLSNVCAVAATSIGVVSLIGWIVDAPLLRSVLPGLVEMKSNTAVGLISSGMSLLLLARRPVGPTRTIGRALAWVVLALGLTTTAEYAFGLDLGIDQLLFREAPGAISTSSPGRMALMSAIDFVLIGSSLLLLDVRTRSGRRPFETIAWAASVVAATALLAYLYGADSLYGVAPWLPAIAIHTALAFVSISLGIVFARRDGGVAALLEGDAPGSLAVRRLAPAIVLLLPAIGWIRIRGEQAGLYPPAMGVAMFTVVNVIALLAIVFRSARSVNRTDDARRRADAVMVQAKEEAERANRAKDEFLSRMSHELRTPMNAVLGFAQLLALDDLSPEQASAVEHIEKGGRHLLGLIDEILDVSRIAAGKLALSTEPVAVDEVLADARTLIGALAATRRVNVHVDTEPGLFVRADVQRLRQTMLNLLSNAVKYNRDGGSVTVRSSATRGTVRIVVADTGIGIAPENLDRLFLPFDRLGAETSNVEGTGLGLALTKGLVEAMAGSIHVESEPGVGTTVSVELPATEAAAAFTVSTRAPVPRATDGDEPTRTIVYIEDNASNIALVSQVLLARNVRLSTATTGREGLDLVRRERPDLILLDLHLPEMSGEEVLAALKDDPDVTAPVIVISADALPSTARRILASGAADHLTKPIDVGSLLATVDRLLRKRVPRPGPAVPSVSHVGRPGAAHSPAAPNRGSP